ncbi:hypothetical protein SDC9_198493 [bioreactor metagenome]|uniref:Uncharacterized protein n=1 Tax=bioreactor metagenome TaxID=1076179 RepID=A0A645IUM3_9ZZZZ
MRHKYLLEKLFLLILEFLPLLIYQDILFHHIFRDDVLQSPLLILDA